jgi:predicted PurR-regulated permease PerM
MTGVAIVTLGTIFVGIIWLTSRVLDFLQPILIPFAVAGVMAYLLDPVVSRLVKWGFSRHRAVFAVFALVTIILAGVMIWIVPALSEQSVNLARKVPNYARDGRKRIYEFVEKLEQKSKELRFPAILTPTPAKPDNSTNSSPVSDSLGSDLGKTTPGDAATTGSASIPPPAKQSPDAKVAPDSGSEDVFGLKSLLSGDWLLPTVNAGWHNTWSLVRKSLGGFMGVLGFLLSLIIVPIYLYYFLIEGPSIAAGWSDYLPLRASAFKDEVVSVLNEINGYLIAFFRGQLVVSLVNGSITALGLVIAGLDFGLLIGIALCFLGLIPYLGITMCWIVSAVIASLQGGSWCVPMHPWWVLPLVISGIFVVVHNIDGLFVTPKIVGESVGLHPLTVIVSVFVWSLLMGGLLGAILAVPMTATVKVLLRRYVWERRFRPPETSIASADLPLVDPMAALIPEIAQPARSKPPEPEPLAPTPVAPAGAQ